MLGDRQELHRAAQGRLLEQAAAPALAHHRRGLAELGGDDVRREWQVEPRRDVRHHLRAAVTRGRDHRLRRMLLDELHDTRSPRSRRVRLARVDRECTHRAEPAGEGQRLL